MSEGTSGTGRTESADTPDPDGSSVVEEAIELDGRTATQVVDLLALLAVAPSTPGGLKDEVEQRSEELGFAIPKVPHQWRPGERRTPGPAALDGVTATGIAGMLELLAELPSTPPDVADDAREHARVIWELLGLPDGA